MFGTTVGAYRLLVRQLLSVAGPRPDSAGEAAGLAVMSFVRAVATLRALSAALDELQPHA